MKTLGLLGGMTWHASADYYRRLNELAATRCGAFTSASLLLRSIDYEHIRRARANNDWRPLQRHLVAACQGLQRGGAEGILICSNTIHQFYPVIQSQVSVDVLHIADAVADAAERLGVRRVGLLGTAFTVTQSFYRDRLTARGLDVLVNAPRTVAALDHILLEELARGERRDPSRQRFLDAIDVLADRGAEAVILGCTEIGMLVTPASHPLPQIDCIAAHVHQAMDWALGTGVVHVAR